MDYLPAMKIAQGEPFSYDFTVEGEDWTGWTGTATFKRAMQAQTRGDWYLTQEAEPLLVVNVTPGAAGLVQLALTPAQTALFPALPKQNYLRQAVCEISMTDGADVRKYQTRVLVAAQI